MDVKAIRASDVPPEPTRWLWKGWLPLRNLSLLAGLPGLGKTTFAVQLAADVTRGTLEGALHGRPADVLIASLEDAIAATLVPRFMAANADLTRVHFVACEKPGSVLDLTAHLPQIDRLAQERDVRLLVVDPLVATLPAGKMSSHKDQDVRSVLAPLAYVAEQRDLAALGLMHFSKSATDALLGVGGSIGFVGAARSVLIFGANPRDDRGEEGPARIVAHRKCNVGRRQTSRACWIEPRLIDNGEAIETSYVILGDEIDISADELVRVMDTKETAIERARKFLRSLLVDGPMKAKECLGLAEDQGIATRTLYTAKNDLDVDSFRKDNVWWWVLPEDDEPAEPEGPEEEPE